MFGSSNGTPAAPSNQPAASEAAKSQSSLTQIIVSGSSSADLFVFLNGQPVPTGDVESLSVEIIAPDAGGQNGSVTAILSQYSAGPTGTRQTQGVSLFPGTVELIARSRRIVVTCEQDGSFDGLWLGLGLRADGTSSELSGVGSLRLTAAPGLVDAKLIWSDTGATEDLLPEGKSALMNKASQMLLIYQAKQIAPGIVMGCLALVFVLCFYLFTPLLIAFDEKGKPAQHGVGMVTNIFSRSVARGNTDPAALVSIKVGDKTTMINTHSALFVGQKLNVDYKIGRNGTLYVDHYLPISDARPK